MSKINDGKLKTKTGKRKSIVLQEDLIEYNYPQSNNKVFNKKKQIEEQKLSKELFSDYNTFQESLDTNNKVIKQSTFSTKKAAWCDEDDNITTQLAFNAQTRKSDYNLNSIKSEKYSKTLENRFLTYHTTPDWAKVSTEHSDAENSDEEILKTSGHLEKQVSSHLPGSILDFKNVSDLNAETHNEGPLITSVDFHPKSTVALVAGISGIVSLFAVDGKHNNKLHNIKLDNFPIENAKFFDNGIEILMGSRYSHIFSFDMLSTKITRIPLPNEITQCKRFEISSCEKIIAVVGKCGNIYLISSKSRELITTLKQNYDISDLVFHPSERLLYGYSTNGEVNIWDLSTHRIKNKWIDEGCLQGSTLSISPSGQLIATGSSQGIVNIYDSEKIFNQQYPKPIKTISNLTTSINCLKFNSTSEILTLSSSEINNAVRLYHLKTKKVFENFPNSEAKFGRINLTSFSPNSGYIALANRKSRVLLYRLKHFKNY